MTKDQTGKVEADATSTAPSTTESPEAPVETPPTADETPKQEDEWVVPGRFRTVEDLRQSYQHLESEYGRRGNELHQLKQRAISAQADPQAEIVQFAEAVKRNPVEAIRNVVKSETDQARYDARQVRFESEYNRLMANPEFAELEPVMAQIANNYRDMLSDQDRQDPRLLHVLFYAARGVEQERLSKQAAKSGQQAGEAAALRKTRAQVEGSSGTKGHVKRKFEDLSLEEMKKELDQGNVG